jgi:hypothetical protein
VEALQLRCALIAVFERRLPAISCTVLGRKFIHGAGQETFSKSWMRTLGTARSELPLHGVYALRLHERYADE